MRTILNNAQQALSRGNYDRAESLLNQATAFAPRDPRPLALQAQLYEQRGQWRKAIKAFNRLLHLEPKESTWRLARARALFRVGAYSQAVSDFHAAQAQNATLTLNDYTLLCEAAFRISNAKMVRRALNMIESMNPEPHPRAQLIRGLMAFRSGQGAKAREILLRAAAIWPDNLALTTALRRTSAVYYRRKRQLWVTNVTQASGSFVPPMTTAETASLQLVQEFTPSLSDPPAIIRIGPKHQSRSTTQAQPSSEPGRLTIIFVDPATSLQDIPAGQTERQKPAADQVTPAGYQSSRQTSIGFRQIPRSDR